MSSYLNKYYSPSKKDYDIKDKTINQLKSDIFELQQNERDFTDLSSQLKNLEYRYSLLQDEKERIDLEYKNRNEVNLKLIASLRTDLDTMKSTISEKNMEIQTLRSELLSSKGESDQWYLDISKVKKELELAIDNENRLEEENRQLEKALDGLKQEKRQLLGELDNLNEGVTEEISKNNELERVIEELIENKRQDEALISELRNSIENKENALVEANRTIDLMELEEKKARKHMEKEGDEVLFLKNKLTSLEGNLRMKENQVASLKKDLDVLNVNFGEALENNVKSDEESRKIIETLSQNNKELLNLLNDMNDQDDQIRELMEKKTRINDFKKRNGTNFRTLYSNGN